MAFDSCVRIVVIARPRRVVLTNWYTSTEIAPILAL